MTIQVFGVDPRSKSKTQLPVRGPLPHVSRRALARVRDRIEPPKACHCCGGPVRLISNAEIYGREYGAWPFAYRCSTCGAYIGLHPDTDLPLGIMADRATTKARKAAKGEFLALAGERFAGKQGEAYAWLARALGIAPSICHFGMFDQQRAQRAGDVCRLAGGPRMTAVTIWILFAFLPAGYDRPPVMRIERFETAAECERVRAIFPPSATVFSCMPSRQIRAGQPIPLEPRQ